ncbi:hypothetical protein [Paenibacillus thalictri]|uniref:Uncharacterized protein n=1 Tax=Paenibacillus thalictri TaxID=2527873 RepID=A0A4Q9DG91_9BACL|nr:hypothetical protein [Paenibacillus thalictri]TBL71220.1 hypothetical protein EYB31_31090 [Paenibacillus thalictri]
MYGKLACFLLLACAMLIHDIPKCKQATRHDRLAYILILAPLLYLGIVFIWGKSWPNLDTLFNLFAPPARQIVRWLDPAST